MLAMALWLAWSRVVPIFEFPDEGVHFKYVVGIYAAGRPLVPRDGTNAYQIPAGRVIPWPTSMEDLTGLSVIAGHRYIKEPPSYGSDAYFRKLDASLRPEPAASLLDPVLLRYYPPGYYLLAAAWTGAASLFVHSAGGIFFATRVLSVALGGAGVGLGFLVLRELGVRRTRAVTLTSVAALLPVTGLVCAAVQPDSLSFALVSATLLAALRVRAKPAARLPVAVLAIGLGLLAATKLQYFLPLAIAGLCALIAGQVRNPGQSFSLSWRLLMLAVPPAVAGFFQYWLLYGAPLVVLHNDVGTVVSLRDAVTGGPNTFAGYLSEHISFMFRDLAFGREFVTFWGTLGWLDTPLVIVNQAVTAATWAVIAAFSVIAFFLGCIRFLIVVGRSLRLAQQATAATRRRAVALLVGNPVVISFYAFTLLMLVYDGEPGLQGRYFVPFLPGILYLAVEVAPKALPRRPRRAFGNLLLVGLAGYAGFSAAFALPVIQERYYGNGRDLRPVNTADLRPVADQAWSGITQIGPPFPQLGVDLLPIQAVGVAGWAVDPGARQPARTVLVQIDDQTPQEAVFGNNSPEAVVATGDPRYGKAGFDLVVRVGDLPAGFHRVTILVVSSDGRRLLAARPATWFLMPFPQTVPQ